MICAALLLAACKTEGSEEQVSIQVVSIKEVRFNALAAQTKTAFGQGNEGVYPTLWTANDESVKLALNYKEAAEAAIVPSEDFRKAGFKADIDASETSAPYVFYAVSPASAARALSSSRKAWNVSIPAVQTPLSGSVDESAMLIAAASLPSDQIPASVDLHFNHLTAYGRMTLANLELDGATIEKLEITATTPFVGDWYWECEDGHALTDNGASSTLTLNTSGFSDIWFACAPVDRSGQTVSFSVFTDKGTLVKKIRFPEGRTFKSGRVAVFSVDMAGVQPSSGDSDLFEKVLDASSLAVGDQIIIANQEGTYALGGPAGTSSKPYRSRVSVVTSGGLLTDAGEATVFTLEEGAESGYWALRTGDSYLCALSKTGNYLSESAILGAFSSWSITITGEGDATIEAKNGSSRIIRENVQNDRFSAYGSNSSLKTPVSVYRKCASVPGPEVADPLLDYTDYGFYKAGAERVYAPGADQYCRSYSSDGVQTFTILNPAGKEQLEIRGYSRSLVKGDAVSVTVNWKKGKTYVIKSEKYNLSLVKEDGPRVWLGDGSGNGFIIKK